MSTLDKDNKKSIRKFNKIWKRDISPSKVDDETGAMRQNSSSLMDTFRD